MVTIFFMLLKIPPFLHLLLSRVYNLHKVEIKNKNCWRFFEMPLPRSVIFFLNLFSKGIERCDSSMKIEKLYKHPWYMCKKRLQHYMISFIAAILSAMSGYITEQCISAIDCNPLFSSLEK